MKQIISIILLLIVGSCHSNGQVNPHSLVKFSDIKLVKSNMASTYFINGDSKTSIINAYGNPASVTTMPWDSLDETVEAYSYNGNSIFIETDNQSLWGFEILNTDFKISFNNHLINVGDDISTLSGIFNTSYTHRYSDLISVGLTTDIGLVCDYTFEIYFNPSTNKITKLAIGYY